MFIGSANQWWCENQYGLNLELDLILFEKSGLGQQKENEEINEWEVEFVSGEKPLSCFEELWRRQ